MKILYISNVLFISGIKFYGNGARYEGDFLDDKFSGKGKW